MSDLPLTTTMDTTSSEQVFHVTTLQPDLLSSDYEITRSSGEPVVSYRHQHESRRRKREPPVEPSRSDTPTEPIQETQRKRVKRETPRASAAAAASVRPNSTHFASTPPPMTGFKMFSRSSEGQARYLVDVIRAWGELSAEAKERYNESARNWDKQANTPFKLSSASTSMLTTPQTALPVEQKASIPAPQSTQNDETSFIAAVTRIVTCSICMELMTLPTVTDCNHIFCFPCLSRAFNRPAAPRACPLCRAQHRTIPRRSRSTEEIVELIVPRLDESQRERFAERMKEDKLYQENFMKRIADREKAHKAATEARASPAAPAVQPVVAAAVPDIVAPPAAALVVPPSQ